MRKHGALPGNRPNPAWTNKYKKTHKKNKTAKASRKKNR